MKTLRELQDSFQRGILAGDDAILGEVKDSDKEQRKVLFGVYRNAYVARLAEILADDYQQLHSYLGDQAFARLVKAYIEAVGAMNHDREATLKVLAKYFKRSDANFLDETYALVTRFTEKTPRLDTRNVATVLEFEPVKGVDAETLTPKVIDNSVVDKLAKDGFIEKVFAKAGR